VLSRYNKNSPRGSVRAARVHDIFEYVAEIELRMGRQSQIASTVGKNDTMPSDDDHFDERVGKFGTVRLGSFDRNPDYAHVPSRLYDRKTQCY